MDGAGSDTNGFKTTDKACESLQFTVSPKQNYLVPKKQTNPGPELNT